MIKEYFIPINIDKVHAEEMCLSFLILYLKENVTFNVHDISQWDLIRISVCRASSAENQVINNHLLVYDSRAR